MSGKFRVFLTRTTQDWVTLQLQNWETSMVKSVLGQVHEKISDQTDAKHELPT